MSFRTFILKIHMFGGVLCAPYLLIFGISSLNYNHKLAFTNEWTEVVTREVSLPTANRENDRELAEGLQEDLGLWGWTPPWEYRRDEKGNFRFRATRPGKSYIVHADFQKQEARIEETAKGYWSVVRQLHALMSVPGSTLMTAWGVYTDLCAAFVLFSIISGVYLWTARRSERVAGLILLGAGSGSSVALILYLWLLG